MDGLLRVDTAATTLPNSPTNSFMADEVASTCPLLTPSPPTNDLINPPSETEPATFTIGDELACKLQQVKDEDKEGGDSASSSSSALAEPVCTQLLNHRHVYHHIIKDENSSSQETNGKVQPLLLTFKHPTEDYFFMTWNWPLIRKLSLWIFLSGLMAMLALVVAMVWTLPKTCNPPTQWYQGSVWYEIFPAGFSDSDEDNVGDFRGISLKAEYLQSLGVRGVRLNPIFNSPRYPYDDYNATSLIEIDPKLGSIHDFRLLVDHLHLREMFVVLDLPVWPLVKALKPSAVRELNETESEYDGPYIEFLRSASLLENAARHDEVTEAILFWLKHCVDGFYLKGLENYVNDVNFAVSLKRWKKILGPDRPIIVNYSVIEKTPKKIINIVLNNVDLVDVRLNIEGGVVEFSKQIGAILNGTLFSKAGMPWVHWNLGSENAERLANRLYHSNATLGAILLQLMLPGTPSILFGDEIGWKGDGTVWWRHPQTQSAETNTDQKNFTTALISKMVELRRVSPSIYVNSVNKDGNNKPNAEVKYSQNDLVVIQRWYSRRKNYVVVSNLGESHKSGDLSTSLYAGEVMIGPRVDSKLGTVSFKSISLWPGESVVVLLD